MVCEKQDRAVPVPTTEVPRSSANSSSLQNIGVSKSEGREAELEQLMNFGDKRVYSITTYRCTGTIETVRLWILPTSCRGSVLPSPCEAETTPMDPFRRGQAKHMFSLKGSGPSVLKTGHVLPIEWFRDSGHCSSGGVDAHASYRDVLQGDRSPALTRELCKPKVSCIYGPASGGKPSYQWVHSRKWRQAEQFLVPDAFFFRGSITVDDAGCDVSARAALRRSKE